MTDKGFVSYTALNDYEGIRATKYSSSKPIKCILAMVFLMVSALVLRQFLLSEKDSKDVDRIQIIVIGDTKGIIPVHEPTETETLKSIVCKPGESKMESCNTCTCMSGGSAWGCTRMFCAEKSVEQGNRISEN